MDLANVLEFNQPDTHLTLIEAKSNADGSFLLHHILSQCIRDPNVSCVLFLKFAHSSSHYQSVQQKLGNSSYLSRGTLVTLDLMHELASGLAVDLVLSEAVKRTEDTIAVKVAAHSSKAYVVIDDLSVAHLCGAQQSRLAWFVHRLASLDKARLILYSQSFASTNRAFLGELVKSTDLYLCVDALSTGYSKDIHGQV